MCALCYNAFTWPQEEGTICSSCKDDMSRSEEQAKLDSVINTLWLLVQLDVIEARPNNYECYEFINRV